MYLNEQLFIDFLNTKEILWVGINFSKAKFTRNGFELTQESMHRLFHEWNMMILNDQKKYDVRMSFRKPVMQYDLSVTTKLNKSVKLNDIMTNYVSIKDTFNDEQICEYVSELIFPTTMKYALTYIVESFNASVKSAAIWVVIVATETHEVVLCEKFLKKPAGIGIRNYWARTFYNVFYDIQSQSFKRWESMVGLGQI
ncbi:MAG: hypothetical protein J6P54_07520 [Bacteroidales bacterium]|nr:hypothetical protein [Bacteroidales bacterium]